MTLIAFFVLALLLIASALVVITNRNPVTSAVALAFNLVAISGLYMVLDAQFVGLLQVIIYAGAIMVLILFVIMLLNLREEARAHPAGTIQRVLAPITSLLFAVVLPGESPWLRHGRIGRPGALHAFLLSVRGDLAPAHRRDDRGGAPREEEAFVIDPRLVLVVSALLLSLGVVGVLTRRGAITILMCVELMLNAGNLAFITFARIRGGPEAQIYVFFVMTLAAAEAAAGLAIVIALFRLRGTTDVDEINLLKW